MHAEQLNLDLAAEELDLLTAVLDALIPASDDGRFPGAGSLGCARQVARNCSKVPGLLELVRCGLRELAESSRARWNEPFEVLRLEAREQLLAHQSFVLPLLIQAYIVYYQQPAVLAALGLEPRPPHPQGYAMREYGEDPAPKG